MTHTAGLLSVPCTARGGTVVVVTKPDPALLLAAIPKYRVTELFLPPTVIYRLLDIPDLGRKADFSSLKYFMYGAAPMSVEKLKQAIEVIGPVMMGGYGQTEAPASISYLPPDEHFADGRLASDERLSSVGRPNPLISVEIMNDASQILPPGETGEICVRGDLVMKGYYKAPDKTAETIVDGWLHTGDIGHIDADGLPAHHRPQEGHDHLGRLQRLPERGRAGDLEPPGGAGLRGDRRARRQVGRGRQGRGRTERRPAGERRRTHRAVQGEARLGQGAEVRRLRRLRCRAARSARC